jgi:hypothetical protein
MLCVCLGLVASGDLLGEVLGQVTDAPRGVLRSGEHALGVEHRPESNNVPGHSAGSGTRYVRGCPVKPMKAYETPVCGPVWPAERPPRMSMIADRPPELGFRIGAGEGNRTLMTSLEGYDCQRGGQRERSSTLVSLARECPPGPTCRRSIGYATGTTLRILADEGE